MMNATEKLQKFADAGEVISTEEVANAMNARVVKGGGSTAGVPQIQVQGPEAFVLGVLAAFKGLIDLVPDLEVRYNEVKHDETRPDGTPVRPWAKAGDVSMTLLPFASEVAKPKPKTLADWSAEDLEAEVARRKAAAA